MTTATLNSKSNNLAVAAIVLSAVVPVVAICLGAVALEEIAKTEERGRTLAIVAILVGTFVLLAVGIYAGLSIAQDVSSHPARWIRWLS